MYEREPSAIYHTIIPTSNFLQEQDSSPQYNQNIHTERHDSQQYMLSSTPHLFSASSKQQFNMSSSLSAIQRPDAFFNEKTTPAALKQSEISTPLVSSKNRTEKGNNLEAIQSDQHQSELPHTTRENGEKIYFTVPGSTVNGISLVLPSIHHRGMDWNRGNQTMADRKKQEEKYDAVCEQLRI